VEEYASLSGEVDQARDAVMRDGAFTNISRLNARQAHPMVILPQPWAFS
jgi:hypothetical protein